MLLLVGSAEAAVDYRSAPGRVSLNVDETQHAEITAVAALPGGAVLAAGSYLERETSRVFVVRLRRDGSLDRSYGDSGVARLDGTGIPRIVGDDDGGATVVMSAIRPAGPGGSGLPAAARLVRLDATGRIAPAFGAAGVHDVPGLEAIPGDELTAPAPARGVYVAAHATGTRSPGVVNVTESGAVDPAFGAQGMLAPPLREIARLGRSGSDLLVLGMRSNRGGAAVLRYGQAGKPDDTFGDGGMVELSGLKPPFDLATDDRGRIWIHGTRPNSDGAAEMLRLRPDGQRDTSFRFRSLDPRPRPARYPTVSRLLLTPRGATVAYTATNLHPRVFVFPIAEDGKIGAPARFRPELGGGDAPPTISRDEGTLRGMFYTSRDAIAQRPDGTIVIAGGVELGTREAIEAALLAIHDGRTLDRRFGRPTGPPTIRLASAHRRSERELLVELRTNTRGVARLTLRLHGRRISRRMLAFPRAGSSSKQVRMFLTPTARRSIRNVGGQATATLHVTANDMAGNRRHTKFTVRL